jgi:predicted ester cyclase
MASASQRAYRSSDPACFYSTALWLRAAFEGMHYDIHHAIADGNLIVVNSTMNGRHTAPWTVYAEDGSVDNVFPATGRTFAMTQSHWFLLEDGRIIDHWANRDDLGMAVSSAGFRPPPPSSSKWPAPSAAPSAPPRPDPPERAHPSGDCVPLPPSIGGKVPQPPIIRRSAAAAYSSGASQSTPSGGTVMVAEAGRPW